MSASLEQFDLVVSVERDDGPLGVGAAAPHTRAPVALPLALAVQRVHVEHAHREDRLDCVVDLGLRRVRVHAERVRVALEQCAGLLRHDRLDADVAGVLHDSPSSDAAGAAGSAASTTSAEGSVAVVKTTTSLASTSCACS